MNTSPQVSAISGSLLPFCYPAAQLDALAPATRRAYQASLARLGAVADVAALDDTSLSAALRTMRAHHRGQPARHPPAKSADVPANRPDHDGASNSPKSLPPPQQVTVPFVRTPQEWAPLPADTDVNEPDGATACPCALLPQQTAVPSLRTPHECHRPADTDVNEADGASVAPEKLLPQQTAVPSLRTPHECPYPADTDVNEPDGATARPSLLPQQTAVPFVRTPHKWPNPADTDVNEPDGAAARPSSLLPQQTTVPSVRTPHECEPPADTDVNEPDGAAACPSS